MKRFTKEELTTMNASLEREAQGLRILTTELLHNKAPFFTCAVEFYSSEMQGDYREVWSHFRPDSACGGVILIEQFELESGRRIAHRTVLGTELNALVNGMGGPGRADMARRCFKNQFDAVGTS